MWLGLVTYCWIWVLTYCDKQNICPHIVLFSPCGLVYERRPSDLSKFRVTVSWHILKTDTSLSYLLCVKMCPAYSVFGNYPVATLWLVNSICETKEHYLLFKHGHSSFLLSPVCCWKVSKGKGGNLVLISWWAETHPWSTHLEIYSSLPRRSASQPPHRERLVSCWHFQRLCIVIDLCYNTPPTLLISLGTICLME